MTGWLANLARQPNWRAYLGLDGGRAVASGFLYLCGDDAWLGMGATLPEHRGRGAQGALMALRIREAIAAGCSRIATETGCASRSVAMVSFQRLR